MNMDRKTALANEIITEQEWFEKLPDHMKDHRSQPNHDMNQAKRAVELALLVLGREREEQSEH